MAYSIMCKRNFSFISVIRERILGTFFGPPGIIHIYKKYKKYIMKFGKNEQKKTKKINREPVHNKKYLKTNIKSYK